MAVGTQKDYYGILGVDRQGEHEKDCETHKALGSKVAINLAAMSYSMKSDDSTIVIDPQKHPVVANTILVNSCQIGRRIPKRLRDQLGVGCKVVDFLSDSPGNRRVEIFEFPLKPERRLDPVSVAHRGSACLESRFHTGICCMREDAPTHRPRGDYRLRRLGRSSSRLNSSQDRVFPESCSRRALRSLRKNLGLCTIRKSSKASCNSSNASEACSNLFINSVGTCTVSPIPRLTFKTPLMDPVYRKCVESSSICLPRQIVGAARRPKDAVEILAMEKRRWR